MDRSFCIAPMMARTDRHFRYLVRQLTRKAVLFTEMIHTNSILFGNRNKLDEGMLLDAKNQLIVVAFEQGFVPNIQEIISAINKAGYETTHYYKLIDEVVQIQSL